VLLALAAAPATWGLIVGGGDHERLRTLARRLGVVG
jgi:hypothetical protein